MKQVGVKGVGTEGSYNIGPKDENLSVEHLKDSLDFNLSHAEDHLKIAKEVCERMKNARVEYTIPKSFLDLAEYFSKNQLDSKLKDVGNNMARRSK